MLCWLGGVDAGSCWGAACCASRDVAARAVSACGRHPRAHAQLRGTGGRWRRRRTATATRSPASGTELEARRTFCNASDARRPAGVPARQRRHRPVSALQHARRPGVLHLDVPFTSHALSTVATPHPRHARRRAGHHGRPWEGCSGCGRGAGPPDCPGMPMAPATDSRAAAAAAAGRRAWGGRL